MTERKQLLEEALSLGLKFAKNAKSTDIQKMVDQAKSESAMDDARAAIQEPILEEGEELADVILEEAPRMSEAELRAEIEAEFEAKMKLRMANMEKNVNDEVSKRTLPIGQIKLNAIKEATKLVRCVVTCRDPAKQTWTGEIFNVSNDLIGDQKKYIPFGEENGYHVPQIIFNTLKDKKCTVFVNKRVNGETVKVGKQIKAYGLEVLPPLTQEELSELGSEQAARMSIDA